MKSHNELTDRKFWEGHWHDLPDAKVISSGHGSYGRRGYILNVIRRHFGDPTGIRVIELGGGASYRLLALVKWASARATAIDYSERGISQTKAIFAANNCDVQTILADIFKFNPGEEKYDLVVHWGLLEHFDDPTPLLRASSGFLKPGGKIVFGMPNMEAWGAYIWRRFSPDSWSVHKFHSDSEIEKSCKDCDLVLEKKFHFGYPLLNITAWENPGPVGRVVSSLLSRILQALVALEWILPIYHRGTRKISSERGFVVRHRAD